MKQNKIIVIGALILPIIALFIWVVSIQVKILNSDKVRVVVTGYDPRDLLSGHYVVLRPLWDKTDCAQFKDEICPIADFDYSYRFYLPEDDAKYLDRVIPRSSGLYMELEFAMPYSSKPVVKELYIENLAWREWLKENPPKDI